MAHRHEHCAVREPRPGRRRRAGTLSVAVVAGLVAVAGALSATGASASDWTPRSELDATALPDVVSWMDEYGRPAWFANRWLDTEGVWTMAGLVRGTWRLDEPGRAPQRLIDPAGLGSFTPLSWYDSVAVTQGTGAAWQGFDGALATVEARTAYGQGPRSSEGIVDLRSGDGAWDENSLMVARRDSLSWVRIDSHGLNRSVAGTLDPAGRHLWGFGAGYRYRKHSLDVAFSQHGIAGGLFGSENEDRRGQVGSATYRYHAHTSTTAVTFSRGRTTDASYAEYPEMPYSRRTGSFGELGVRTDFGSGLAAGIQWRDEHVARDVETPGSPVDTIIGHTFRSDARSLWGSVGWAGDLGGGRLAVDVGAGKHGAYDAIEIAPSVRYDVASGGIRASIGAERAVDAVWTDLPVGQAPFMQRSIVGVADVTFGTRRATRLRTMVLAGRTASRAVGNRTPLTEVVLRAGWREDPDPYTFALFAGEGRLEWRRWFMEANAFGLVKPAHAIQPNVDPVVGGRAILGRRWLLFKGDLGLEAYGGTDLVGMRESDARPAILSPYAVSSVGVLFTIASATFTIRWRNLENVSPPEPWRDTSLGLDPFTGGEALGPGREMRLGMVLALRN